MSVIAKLPSWLMTVKSQGSSTVISKASESTLLKRPLLPRESYAEFGEPFVLRITKECVPIQILLSKLPLISLFYESVPELTTVRYLSRSIAESIRGPPAYIISW